MIPLIPITPDVSNEIDYNQIAKKSFVNVDEVLKPQPIALSIGKYEYKGAMYPVPIASYGDFFCIVGASKSRKTYVKKTLLARYIGGYSESLVKSINAHNNEGKVIIDNDTEQSLFHTQLGARQVLEMTGIRYDKYMPYSMRSLEVEQRIGLIKWQLANIENIGIMFIDGVADLVKNVNDLDECNSVVQMLMTWSKDYNICIGTILHMNYGSTKATGHLGSAVTKKAETVISVVTDDGVTNISAQYTRNRPFNDIAILINGDGLPQETNSTNKGTHGY